MSDPIRHPHQATVEDHRAHVGGTLADMLRGVGVLLVGLAALLFVLWLMLADVKAVPFDADGVRCYKGAQAMACLKTAEPAR